jgi:hypothetical protein
MKRLLLVILFGLIAFYIAWPAISAWQIHGAIKAKDPARLSQKIDFASVRQSMRPAVEGKISKKVEEIKANAGGTAAIVAGLVQGGMLEKITSIVLQSIVTPENMIRLASELGSLPEKIDRIVKEQIGQFGGAGIGSGNSGGGGSGAAGSLFGGLSKQLDRVGGVGQVVKTIRGGEGGDKPAGGEAAKTAQGGSGQGEPPAVGLSNIKSFGFAGPLAFDIGFARDPAAEEAELTARMAFQDFDWKLTQVVPNIK